MYRSCLTALALIVSCNALAGEAYTTQTAGRFTEIAGQEAGLMGDRIIFFVKGYGRAIEPGDTLVCAKRDQEVSSVAQMFRSSPFTFQYARTMESLAQRGYNWLDGGCVIGHTPAEAYRDYERLGGTVDLKVEVKQDQWRPAREFDLWTIQSSTINGVDTDRLTKDQFDRWYGAILDVKKQGAQCPDVGCFNRLVAVADQQLTKIRKESGQ